jgi:hypothetical protein
MTARSRGDTEKSGQGDNQKSSSVAKASRLFVLWFPGLPVLPFDGEGA